MKKQMNVFQTREQGKTLGKNINQTPGSNSLNKELKIMFIKMLTNIRRRMYEHRTL